MAAATATGDERKSSRRSFAFGNTSSSDLAFRYIREKQAGMKEVPLKLRYCTRRSYLQRISSVGYEVASYDYGLDIYRDIEKLEQSMTLSSHRLKNRQESFLDVNPKANFLVRY